MPRTRRGTNKIIGLCLLCLFMVGCRSTSTVDVTIASEVTPQPPRVGQAVITLRVSDVSGKPVSGARLKLEGNMSHAGMAPIFADATEVEAGRYRTSMELTMAGDWIVMVHLTLVDGTKVDRQFEIKGVAPA